MQIAYWYFQYHKLKAPHGPFVLECFPIFRRTSNNLVTRKEEETLIITTI